MKGTLTDLPIIMVLLFGGALTIFITYFVLGEIFAVFPTDVTQSTQIFQKGIDAFTVFDQMFLVFAIGVSMFTVISAFFIDSHPVFFIFSALLMLPIIIFGSAQVTNVFYEFATTSTFTSVSNTFPYITTFMTHLPLFFLIIGILTAVVMHAKPSGASGGGV